VTPVGAVCDQPVASADLYRTIQEMAGIELTLDAAQQTDGVSIVPQLKEPKSPLARDSLYWHYPHYYPTNTPSSAVRRGNWKLIEYYEDDRVELYNLAEDLGETRDLAETETGRTAEMRTELREWLKQVDAQFPTRH
jgi:uncharacterized sulfatase